MRRRPTRQLVVLIIVTALIYHVWPSDLRTALDELLDNAIPNYTNLYFRSLPTCTFADTSPHPLLPVACPIRDTPNAVDRLCSSLIAKHVLFIGPETTYYLHSLWLNALEAHDNRSITCHGARFCTFHHVCRKNSTDLTHARSVKFPHQDQLIATNSSVLRYVLSTTLHASDNDRDGAYIQPTIDPDTGVRVNNAYWLRHARRADVVVVNRGPIPAPAWTYTSASRGNWTFASRLYANSSTAYIRGGSNSFAVRVVNAALHNTLTVFLPSTMHALQVLESMTSEPERVLIWHSSWYLHARCSMRGKPKWGPFLLRDPLNLQRYADPWTLYYNAQVYMQNRVMSRLVGQYGGVFYALGIPESPEKIEDVTKGKRLQAADCLLYGAGTTRGKLMQRIFLSGLAEMLNTTIT